MITLYGMSSPNILKVTIMLEESGLDYQMRYVNLFAGEQFADDFLKISPNNKVPAIHDDDGPGGAALSLCESGAILLYLAEKAGRLLPTEGAARALTIQWLVIQLASVGPMFGQYLHFARYAPAGSDYGLERYTSELRRILTVLERRLEVEAYLGGPHYSIADIATYPWVRAATTQFPCLAVAEGSHALERYPALRRWYECLGARTEVVAGLTSGERFLPEDIKALSSLDADGMDRIMGRGRFAHH
ncbi:MAG: glutathione S-transferase N-terminal domain-containing protein [Gammaproteobacteria bacterium]